MQLRRVVITGSGVVSPLGVGLKASWEALIAGQSAAMKIDTFNVDDLACKIACPIDDERLGFCPEDYMPAKEVSRFERFIHLGVAAAAEVQQAGLESLTDEERLHCGVMLGSGIGGFDRIAETHEASWRDGAAADLPIFVQRSWSICSGYVSILHGFKGPNHAAATACATGAHAIGDAARLIMFGDADVMVAGALSPPSVDWHSVDLGQHGRCRPLSMTSQPEPRGRIATEMVL